MNFPTATLIAGTWLLMGRPILQQSGGGFRMSTGRQNRAGPAVASSYDLQQTVPVQKRC